MRILNFYDRHARKSETKWISKSLKRYFWLSAVPAAAVTHQHERDNEFLSHTHTLEKGSSWWVHWKSCKLRLVIKISMYLFYGIMRDVRVKEKFDWDFQSADQLLYCWALMNFQFFERNDGFVRHKTPSSIIDVNSIYFWIN